MSGCSLGAANPQEDKPGLLTKRYRYISLSGVIALEILVITGIWESCVAGLWRVLFGRPAASVEV